MQSSGPTCRRASTSARERLLIPDTWQRPKMPAKDFAALVGISQPSPCKWRSRFVEEGPAGLGYRPRGSGPGNRRSDEAKRAILMMKQVHPALGQEWCRSR